MEKVSFIQKFSRVFIGNKEIILSPPPDREIACKYIGGRNEFLWGRLLMIYHTSLWTFGIFPNFLILFYLLESSMCQTWLFPFVYDSFALSHIGTTIQKKNYSFKNIHCSIIKLDELLMPIFCKIFTWKMEHLEAGEMIHWKMSYPCCRSPLNECAAKQASWTYTAM